MSLTEFVLARIADHEDGVRMYPFTVDDPEWAPFELAKCAAEREIVALLADTDAGGMHPDAWTVMKQVVRFMALPYADHEDYREEWRP